MAETQNHPLHARIGRHHRAIPGEQQHSVRGGRIELRQQPQGAPGGGQRTANHGWQGAVPAEHLGAGAQRVETQVDGRTCMRHGSFERRSRRTQDGIGRQHVGAAKNGKGCVAAGGCRFSREHFPREQGKRIGRRRGKKTVKGL
jgi:hypothetical protein